MGGSCFSSLAIAWLVCEGLQFLVICRVQLLLSPSSPATLGWRLSVFRAQVQIGSRPGSQRRWGNGELAWVCRWDLKSGW